MPKRAVVEDANTNSFRVFAIDEKNVARIRVVQLAARQQGDTVRILSGVKEGERVATRGLADLYDGAQVTVSATAAIDRARVTTQAGKRPSHAETR